MKKSVHRLCSFTILFNGRKSNLGEGGNDSESMETGHRHKCIGRINSTKCVKWVVNAQSTCACLFSMSICTTAIAIRASHSIRRVGHNVENVHLFSVEYYVYSIRLPLNRFESCATGHTCCISYIEIQWYWKTKIYSLHMAWKWPNEGKRKPMSEIRGSAQSTYIATSTTENNNKKIDCSWTCNNATATNALHFLFLLVNAQTLHTSFQKTKYENICPKKSVNNFI